MNPSVRTSRRLFLAGLCWLGLALCARADFQTASNRVSPDSINQGGDSTSFTSHNLIWSIGEVSGPDEVSTSHQLKPGFPNLLSTPGSVSDLAVTSKSSNTVTLEWSAPGYDGFQGNLPAGTSFFIQASTDPAESWSYANAQLIVSTSGVSPGSAAFATVPGLFANTTYYFRLWTMNGGAVSDLSSGATTMTLARVAGTLPATFLNVFSSSVTVDWAALAASPSSATASGYVLEACRLSDFSTLVLSSSTTSIALSTLTVINMNASTTYYFRVGTLNGTGDPNYQALGSTTTLNSTDVTPPAAVTDLSAQAVSDTQMRLSWTAPLDPTDIPLNGRYFVEYSTWTGVVWSTTNAQVILSTTGVVAGTAQSIVVNSLLPNVTHYFKLWTADLGPNDSAVSNQAARATLSSPLPNAAVYQINATSLTVRWDAMPASPQQNSAIGYRVQASTAVDFTGTVFSSATAALSASTLTIAGLALNTTYYLRAASLNIENQPDDTLFATATLTTPPLQVSPDILGVSTGDVTARWAALPTTPSTATSEGFRLEASSTGFAAGTVILSSSTSDPRQSTLTVTGLLPDTVYAFRVGSLNWNGNAAYTTLASTATLAGTVGGLSFSSVGASSAGLSWSAPGSGASGYGVQASTAANFTGTVLSSSTSNGALTQLTVSTLLSNTTYFFRVLSLNPMGAPNASLSVSTSTLATPPVRILPDEVATAASSVTVRWAALPPSPQEQSARGYRLDASSTNFSGGVVYSSETSSVALSTLTVIGLDANATYYFRVGSLNWNGVANYTALADTATLAIAPTSAASTFTAVSASSLSVQWLGTGNPVDTLYLLQASTASNFTGTLSSTVAASPAATISSLSANTTYYVSVQALNRRNVGSAFTSLGSTVTLASTPAAAPTVFWSVNASSLTVNFTAGSPADPTGTRYLVQIATEPTYSAPVSSSTLNLSSTFTALSPNSAIYARVQAFNALNIATAFQDLGSTATLATAPGPNATPYSNLAADGFTLSWTSGTAGLTNPDGTLYEADASPSSTFSSGVVAVSTTGLSADFSGLVPGTVYYTRVVAFNSLSVPSAYTTYGSTTTSSSSKPGFIAGTFQVTNASGQWLSGAAYTNTLSPSLRVSVQSSFTPGLATADTPAHLALWHMDEGSGSSVQDASRHSHPLTLVNSPAWVSGQLGSALSFDGATQYGVAGSLSPWRSSAANNTWSVALWFKTTLAHGYLFQTASANTLAAGTSDGELSWYDSTGNLAFAVSNNSGTRRYVQAGLSYADGNWHFVVGVLNASGMQLYVDGQLVGSATTVTASSARTYTTPYAWIGAASVQNANTGGGNFQYYPGVIDDVMISTVGFSASQVLDLYNVTNTYGLALGAPNVDISTSSGANFTWTRTSTTSFTITGTNGTTAAQTFTSSLSVAGLPLVQTTTPGSTTDRVSFIASSVDGNQTVGSYTVLVDTTAPTAPAISSLAIMSSTTVTLAWTSATDALSGLAASPYKVDVSTDPAFGGASSSGWISALNFTFSSLMPNSTYYARVWSQDAAGNTAVSVSSSAITLARPVSGTSFTAASSETVTAAWSAFPLSPSSMTATGFRLEASTTSFNGSGVILASATPNVTLGSLTVNGLSPNTTYQFRTASLNAASSATYAAIGSTVTLPYPPTSVVMTNVFVSSMTAAWTAPPGGDAGYRLEASTASDFTGAIISSQTTNAALLTLTLAGLTANTTYFVRVSALNWLGAVNPSTSVGQCTLANPPVSPSITAAYVSSATVVWSVPAGGASGYSLEASTASDFSGTLITSVTANGAATSLAILPLASDTTFYLRVGSLNLGGAANYSVAGSTKTQISVDVTPPNAVTDLSVAANAADTFRLSWTAPSDPTNSPINGQYAVQFSTWSGVTWSTTSAQVLISTTGVVAGTAQRLDVAGLNPNTTYYLRLWTADSKPNWSSPSSTATGMTWAPNLTSVVVVAVASSTIRIGWAALPTTPPSATASGYRLEVSTASDFTGTLFSSATADVMLSTLQVAGLSANTTYFARAASINGAGAANFAAAITTASLSAAPVRILPDEISVQLSSVTARWASLPASPATATAEGYRLEASTAADFTGTVMSSVTTSVSASTLSLTGLSLNTTYFFRVGALNWNGNTDYTALSATATLAAAPVSMASTFTAVDNTTIAAQWSGAGNPADTSYRLDVSTSSGFTGTLFSSATVGSAGTVTALSPNTTYFARVAAFNRLNVASSFTSLGSTITAASVPLPAATVFTPVYSTSMTVSFTAGSPANPAGTRYQVNLSNDPSFATTLSSTTANLFATFTGLAPSTTYYAEVLALNAADGQTVFQSLGSTETLAVAPGTAAGTYSNLAYDGFTLNWSSGAAGTGFDGPGTVYAAQISLTSGFASVVQEVDTTNLSADFAGLTAGTVYFARVQAVGVGGDVTAFTTYGSTTTDQSSKPSFLAGSFQVTNGSGQWIDGSLYTNSLSPSVRIQAQSAFAPGLAVTNTGAHTALWHMDEGTGSSVADASNHSRPLTLTNGPAWISGQLGGALDFDGSTQYGVSANLNPWRSTAANNQWTVALWFRSTLGRGFLFQTAAGNTLANATYDAELSWHDSTGKLAFEVTTSGGTRTIIQAPSSYTDGNWHFVTAVLNSAGMVLYVDGQSVSTGSGVTASTARTYTTVYAWVGAATTQGATMGGGNFQYYPGDIDEVLVASTAFSAGQVKDLYDLGHTRGIAMGAPNVQVSTSGGANFTWTRASTTSISISGVDGTTTAQTFTSSLSVAGLSLVETTTPGGSTNQIGFIASSLDANQTTSFYAVLVDTTPPVGGSVSGFTSVSSYSATVNWNAASDALSDLTATPYDVHLSSNPSFLGEQASGSLSALTYGFAGLLPNTTYYARLHATDNAGNASTDNASTATLAGLPIGPAFATVGGSSVAVSWTVPSGAAEGYQVDASTASDFTGALFSSGTANGSITSLTVAGLSSNVTYYFRVASLNWRGAPNYQLAGSTLTADIVPPAAVTDLSVQPGVAGHTLVVSWTAPGDNGSLGTLDNAAFVLQYTTDTVFASGAGWSPTGGQPADVARVVLSTNGVVPGSLETTTLTGLTSGATYQLRLWTRDDAGNYASLSNGATTYATPANLSVVLSTDALAFGSLSPGTTTVWSSSITVTNTGNVMERYLIRLVNPSTWTATTGGAGIDTFRLTGVFRTAAPASSDFDPTSDTIVTTDGTSSTTVYARDADADSEKGFNVLPGEQRSLWLRIEMPPISSTTAPQVIRLTATASE